MASSIGAYTPPNSKWVGCTKPNPHATLRLFCLPYAGGGAGIFRSWPERLPFDVELCAIHLPGREHRLREDPFTDLLALVEAIACNVISQLNKPFAFLGHSMGAIISFELARYLRREHGLEPVHLFVSGRAAPHVPRRHPRTCDLPEPQLMDELRRLNGTPQGVLEHPELLQLMLPILRADFKLIQSYVYEDEQPLESPISAFGGLQDHDVSRQDIEEWAKHTTSAFKLSMFPGDHFFLQSCTPVLLWKLSLELQQIADALKLKCQR